MGMGVEATVGLSRFPEVEHRTGVTGVSVALALVAGVHRKHRRSVGYHLEGAIGVVPGELQGRRDPKATADRSFTRLI